MYADCALLLGMIVPYSGRLASPLVTMTRSLIREFHIGTYLKQQDQEGRFHTTVRSIIFAEEYPALKLAPIGLPQLVTLSLMW